MDTVFNDFREELSTMDKMCLLKTLGFEGDHLPDYEIPVIQQLYLLRYFPAYIVEYYRMYEKLIDYNHIGNVARVISIGTGCGIDYCALEYVLQDNETSCAESVIYTGIDKVDWLYREHFDNPDCAYYNMDLTEWTELDRDDYNVICFPKSIGEFSESTFEYLLDIIRKTDFTEDRIGLVASIRNSRSSFDVKRLLRVAKVLQQTHGFRCINPKHNFWYTKEPMAFNKYAPELFYYPDEVKEFITNLIDECGEYDGRYSCEDDCGSRLNRWPILKTTQLKYHVKLFEK